MTKERLKLTSGTRLFIQREREGLSSSAGGYYGIVVVSFVADERCRRGVRRGLREVIRGGQLLNESL